MTDGWRPVEAAAAAWAAATLAAAPGRAVVAAGVLEAMAAAACGAAAAAAAAVAAGAARSGAAGVGSLAGWVVVGALAWSPVCWFVWFPGWLLWWSLSAPMPATLTRTGCRTPARQRDGALNKRNEVRVLQRSPAALAA